MEASRGLKFAGQDGVVTLDVTKKVPLSGEVRLGSYRTARLGDLILHNLINCLSPELQLSFQRQSRHAANFTGKG